MRITDKYVFFYGGIFSQWHKTPIYYKGIWFNCAEQAMMYHKAIMFRDIVTARAILLADSPKEQKALGRKVTPFDPKEWNAICRGLVTDINLQKFSQNPELRAAMLDTGDRVFVEASPFDKVWGIGLRETAQGIEDNKNWKGKNWLGYCLSDVRLMLKLVDKLSDK
jgi:ribA/ribD-fused uncharacterized protein